MAGIVGALYGWAIYGSSNANLSTEFDELTEVVTDLAYYDSRLMFEVFRDGDYRISASNSWGITGEALVSFKDDFYERIHIFPSKIDLGTIASTQSREISVWNAYTKLPATLDEITLSNGAGISVIGALTPVVFQPLQELFWTVRVTPNGPPQINASLFFDFTGVADPLAVPITGSRAVVMPIPPNPPVQEKWSWLTDVHVSVDGSEQRISLRANPRRRLSAEIVFGSEAELREQYKILLSAVGRLFIPYFQYSSTLIADALEGESVLVFDTGPADLRDLDYVLAIQPNNQQALIQLDAIGQSSATTQSPLSLDLPKGTRIVGVFPSILPNNLTLSRGAINTGTMTLQSDASYPRPVVRPGNRVGITLFDGIPVLERRPLADSETNHEYDTGQTTGDAKTGLVDMSTDWDFTRVEQTYTFKANRVARNRCGWMTGTDEMDYWREFADTVHGSLNPFLLSSYRPDQVLAALPGAGASAAVFLGASYVENFWPTGVYGHLALTTAAGVHYAKVTAASKDEDGNSSVGFEPPLPGGAGWEDIQQVSYLQKLRIADDVVKLDHWPLDTMFTIRTRTTNE